MFSEGEIVRVFRRRLPTKKNYNPDWWQLINEKLYVSGFFYTPLGKMKLLQTHDNVQEKQKVLSY